MERIEYKRNSYFPYSIGFQRLKKMGVTKVFMDSFKWASTIAHNKKVGYVKSNRKSRYYPHGIAMEIDLKKVKL